MGAGPCQSDSGVDAINVVQVLEQAQASQSALDQHFGGRAGLLAAVRAERQRVGLLDEDPALIEALDAITTPAEFCDYMADQLFRIDTDPAAVHRREERLDALRRTDTDAQRLIETLIKSTAQFVQTAIERGLCNPNLDATAYIHVVVARTTRDPKPARGRPLADDSDRRGHRAAALLRHQPRASSANWPSVVIRSWRC